MKQTCKKTKQCKFLWWKWVEKYTEHEWLYRNKEERICSNCHLVQIYFGMRYDSGYREDWRDTVLK